MDMHLSEEQIEKYISRRLPSGELLDVDDHLSACVACMRKTADVRQLSTAGFQRSLFASDLNEHLSYEQLSEFVSGKLSDVDREVVETHRAACHACAVQIDDLIRLREVLEADVCIDPKIRDRSWYEELFSNSIFRITAVAATLLIVLSFFWLALRPPVETAFVPDPTTQSDVSTVISPDNSTAPEPPVAEPKIVASLNDGGRKIELDTTGKVSGLANGEFEQKARAALKDQAIEVPSDVRALRPSAGILMGGSENGLPFKIIGPVGKVVESQWPTLTWQPLKDASGYRIGIYDENFNQVAASPEIKNTNWTPTTPFKRGQIYRWQVTATRNGEEIKSPVRPAPEAKFKVADQTSFNEIERVRRVGGNSHLLLGITYANAGLIDEAEREFQILLKNNPNSDVAKKLLSKVRSAR